MINSVKELVKNMLVDAQTNMRPRKPSHGSHHATGPGSSAIRKQHAKYKKEYDEE